METAVKWEYQEMSLRAIYDLGDKSTIPYRTNDGLNKLGREGWELVSVDNGMAYFKRPVDNHAKLIKALQNRSSLV